MVRPAGSVAVTTVSSFISSRQAARSVNSGLNMAKATPRPTSGIAKKKKNEWGTRSRFKRTSVSVREAQALAMTTLSGRIEDGGAETTKVTLARTPAAADNGAGGQGPLCFTTKAPVRGSRTFKCPSSDKFVFISSVITLRVVIFALPTPLYQCVHKTV